MTMTAAELFGDYVRLDDAAAQLGIHPSTLRGLVAKGFVKSNKRFGVHLFSHREIERVKESGYRGIPGHESARALRRLL